MTQLKAIVAGLTIFASFSAVAAVKIPKIDLIRKFEGGNYNLFEYGCAGARVAVPKGYVLDLRSQSDAQCVAEQSHKKVAGGYEVRVHMKLEVDSDEVCELRVRRFGERTVLRLLSFNCIGT